MRTRMHLGSKPVDMQLFISVYCVRGLSAIRNSRSVTLHVLNTAVCCLYLRIQVWAAPDSLTTNSAIGKDPSLSPGISLSPQAAFNLGLHHFSLAPLILNDGQRSTQLNYLRPWLGRVRLVPLSPGFIEQVQFGFYCFLTAQNRAYQNLGLPKF